MVSKQKLEIACIYFLPLNKFACRFVLVAFILANLVGEQTAKLHVVICREMVIAQSGMLGSCIHELRIPYWSVKSTMRGY